MPTEYRMTITLTATEYSQKGEGSPVTLSFLHALTRTDITFTLWVPAAYGQVWEIPRSGDANRTWLWHYRCDSLLQPNLPLLLAVRQPKPDVAVVVVGGTYAAVGTANDL